MCRALKSSCAATRQRNRRRSRNPTMWDTQSRPFIPSARQSPDQMVSYCRDFAWHCVVFFTRAFADERGPHNAGLAPSANGKVSVSSGRIQSVIFTTPSSSMGIALLTARRRDERHRGTSFRVDAGVAPPTTVVLRCYAATPAEDPTPTAICTAVHNLDLCSAPFACEGLLLMVA